MKHNQADLGADGSRVVEAMNYQGEEDVSFFPFQIIDFAPATPTYSCNMPTYALHYTVALNNSGIEA